MQKLKPRRKWNDLSWIERSAFGLAVFAGGEVGYTTISRDRDVFLLRIESGWSNEYSAAGAPLSAGRIVHSDGTEEVVSGNPERRIVAFIPVPADGPTALFNWLESVAFNGFNP